MRNNKGFFAGREGGGVRGGGPVSPDYVEVDDGGVMLAVVSTMSQTYEVPRYVTSDHLNLTVQQQQHTTTTTTTQQIEAKSLVTLMDIPYKADSTKRNSSSSDTNSTLNNSSNSVMNLLNSASLNSVNSELNSLATCATKTSITKSQLLSQSSTSLPCMEAAHNLISPLKVKACTSEPGSESPVFVFKKTAQFSGKYMLNLKVYSNFLELVDHRSLSQC